MFFDKEEWKILKDDKVRVYGEVVSNIVKIYPRLKAKYSVRIQVPSDIFPWLREVGQWDMELLRANPIGFYLEEARNLWYFGVGTPDEDSLDLWAYSSLPAWAFREG